MAKIKIRIDKKAKVHVDVDGVEGQGCQSLTDALVRALGTPVEVQTKPEYYVELDELTAELYEVE